MKRSGRGGGRGSRSWLASHSGPRASFSTPVSASLCTSQADGGSQCPHGRSQSRQPGPFIPACPWDACPWELGEVDSGRALWFQLIVTPVWHPVCWAWGSLGTLALNCWRGHEQAHTSPHSLPFPVRDLTALTCPGFAFSEGSTDLADSWRQEKSSWGTPEDCHKSWVLLGKGRWWLMWLEIIIQRWQTWSPCRGAVG